MRRPCIGLVLVVIAATGCSTSSHASQAPASSTTAATSSTSSTVPTARSTADLDRQVCAAFAVFWDTPYSGGEPSPAMVATERTLIAVTEATTDEVLHDAVRGVIEGELGLPKFDLRDTAPDFVRERDQLPPDARAALQEVEQNDRTVKSKCAAVGRPIDA